MPLLPSDPRRTTPRRLEPAGAAVVAVALLGACGGGAAPRPNVLLISIDSLRRDHVSAYGRKNPFNPDLPTSPTFDALAADGVLFEDAVTTTSWTLPSHVSLLTGMPDLVHGVTDFTQRLDPNLDTIAERLGRAGYTTRAFFSGPNLHPAFGFSQGFGGYENLSGVDVDLDLFATDDERDMRPVHQASHRTLTSERLVEASRGWIREAVGEGERPFFAFVHFWDPHYDYLPPESHARLFDADYQGPATGEEFGNPRVHWQGRDLQHIRSLYDSEIRFTDDQIGVLLGELEALGVADDTLVVITADHGDEFYEHGKKGHLRTLFDEVVRVPMAMRWPNGIPVGVVAKGQARLQDVVPTVLDLLDLPPGEHVEGKSLRPLWEDPDHPGYGQHLYLDVPFRELELSGWRGDGKKVVWNHREERGWVFDLERDPREQRGLEFDDLETSQLPPVVRLREAMAEMERRRDAFPRTAGHEGELLPDSVMQELEALGYLGDE